MSIKLETFQSRIQSVTPTLCAVLCFLIVFFSD